MTDLSITERVSKAKAKIEGVEKNEENKFAKYKYASVDDVYAATREALAENQLDIVMTEERTEIKLDIGKSPYLMATYKIGFVGEEQQQRTCCLPFTGAQTFEAAVSYVQKQWLRQRFQIPTGEKDADAEEWKHDDPPPQQQQQGQQQKQQTQKKGQPKKQATPPKQPKQQAKQQSAPPKQDEQPVMTPELQAAMHEMSKCPDKLAFDNLWAIEHKKWKEQFTEAQYRHLYDHAKRLKAIYQKKEEE